MKIHVVLFIYNNKGAPRGEIKLINVKEREKSTTRIPAEAKSLYFVHFLDDPQHREKLDLPTSVLLKIWS